MRLWHESLIPSLPRAQLLGQHRECCALRGKGWGRRHSTVDYVFEQSRESLVEYHHLIMDEMKRRGYKPDKKWYSFMYRGKNLPELDHWEISNPAIYRIKERRWRGRPIFFKHDETYLEECLSNLRGKGILLTVKRRA